MCVIHKGDKKCFIYYGLIPSCVSFGVALIMYMGSGSSDDKNQNKNNNGQSGSGSAAGSFFGFGIVWLWIFVWGYYKGYNCMKRMSAGLDMGAATLDYTNQLQYEQNVRRNGGVIYVGELDRKQQIMQNKITNYGTQEWNGTLDKP